MSTKSMILTVTFGLVCATNLHAAAQDPTSMTDMVGPKGFLDALLRQVDDLTVRLMERADGRVQSLAVIGRQSNVAVGPGSIACTSIGVVDQEPVCVTGGDTELSERKEK